MQFNANAFCIQYLGFDHLEEKENARATIYTFVKKMLGMLGKLCS